MVDDTRGQISRWWCGGVSICVVPLVLEKGLEQRRIHHPLVCCQWSVVHEEKVVVNHGSGISGDV
jgi:hypothetical protein